MQVDFNTWHKQPALKTPSPFEKQMSNIYTHEVFKKFQVEVMGLSGCHLMNKVDNQLNSLTIFDFEKNEEFVVEWNATKVEISCVCHLFEYSGYLCRHSLMVLQSNGVFSVPSHYILRRWTKDIRSLHKRKMNEDTCSNKDRYDLLYQKAFQLLEEGSLSNEIFNFAYRSLENALKQCAIINQSMKNSKENVGKNKLLEKKLLDPNVSKTKGAPRRINSGIEKVHKKICTGRMKKVRLY
ncbi:protein FAR-RED IMPAIRED RESPONSE 1-like [Vicia villosa]|uniref:protein FAR-RED IMPAIRED RESPONSE 1-like n=1 Tax=Vicia villosa TaxID=3911 RepID=UPI00273CAA34|nr:protein FAR-RED IMPAIRED RESPONSE 1-like [Vicia villosa]